MRNTIVTRALMASTVFAGAAGLAVAPALAQTASGPVEAQPDLVESPTTGEIIVTGSRIARPNLEQSSPVTVVSAQELSLSQPVSAEEFLRELPGSVPSIGPAVNNGANGSATLNLRNLGSNRNLVLLNERRLVPASLGAVVDLNIIPVALLERVDVFTGGASTVYGADAVAGVTNFITRRDFAGLDVSLSSGISERGDGASFKADLTTGANFDDGRGNAVISVGYTKTRPVLQGAREIGRFSRGSTCTAAQVANNTCATLQVGPPQGSATATPATILFPFTAAVDPTTGTFLIGQVTDYNFNPLNVFVTPLERFNIFGQARYEVSPAIEVYTEAFFTQSIVDQQIAPSGTFFSTLRLPLNNQFLTPTQRLQLCQAAIGLSGGLPAGTDCGVAIANGTEISTQIGRRFTEAGPRRTNFTTNTFQMMAGARGPLTTTLNWDISAQYGESERTNRSEGQGTLTRLQQAVRGCPAGSLAGCVPINLFGGEGSITPAMFNFLNVPTFAFVSTELAAAQAVISGDIGFSSPLASEPVGIAIGAEYRRYGGASGGDGISSTPGEVLGAGAPSLPISGEYDSREVFGELVIPLIEDRPFFHNLTLEAGARYSDYSTSGGNWTYKAGGSWMPVPDIKFRGNYARAVRAPNIGELFQPQTVFLTNRPNDPCAGAAPVGNATLTALCIAQGAPSTSIGSIPQPTAGQINATTGGNPNLNPEIATTITAGVVLQPRFVPGFALTLDWYNIKVRDAISSPSQADVIDACFAQTSPTFQACLDIRRNPLTGGLSGPNDTTFGPFLGLSNLGRLRQEGFDLGASYRRDIGFAILNMNFNGNYTTKSRFQATPTSINRECTGFYSVACGALQPEWSWNLRTTLSVQESDVSLLWRHISSMEVEPTITNAIGGYRNIPAYDYFDLAFQHNVSDNMRMTITVQNLFDRDPPDVGNTIGGTAFNSGNTFPTTYDAVGRRYVVGANLRF